MEHPLSEEMVAERHFSNFLDVALMLHLSRGGKTHTRESEQSDRF